MLALVAGMAALLALFHWTTGAPTAAQAERIAIRRLTEELAVSGFGRPTVGQVFVTYPGVGKSCHGAPHPFRYDNYWCVDIAYSVVDNRIVVGCLSSGVAHFDVALDGTIVGKRFSAPLGLDY
jgi:hypothetical protein